MPSSPASDGGRAARRRPRRRRAAAAERGAARRELARAGGPLQAGAGRPRQLPQARRRARPSAASREARDALLRDWLEAVDSVERALRHDARATRSVEGCGPCSSRWRRSSPARGCSAIGAAGEPLRPRAARGDRRAGETRRGARPHVVDVARSGYAVGDRVLRPAQVIVSRAARPGVADGRRLPRLLRGARRPARRERRGHPPRVPQARAREPPRRQQGAGRRGPLQGDLRGLRGAARPREARALRPPRRRTGRPAQDVSGAAGFEGFARAAAASAAATCASSSAAAGTSATSSRACSAAGARAGGGAAASTASRRAAATRRRCSSSRSRRPRGGGRRKISLGDGRDYEVDIPPGVRDGQRIRLAGRAARRGRRPGRATCSCACGSGRTRASAWTGRDLALDLPVAPWEAALGADGRGADARRDGAREGARRARPAGAGCGCAARACPAARRAGDLYATVKIDGPEEAQRRGARAVRAARRGVDVRPAEARR